MGAPGLYEFIRGIVRLCLGFYFRRIEVFHPERVPEEGPVLFTANHPNSLTDSFVLGSCVERKVNFVGTVQLFQFKPLKWLLSACGVIPINRVKDDPRAMRTVAETFEACFRVLERGEAVGIFPEGITHDDPQLKTVKSGAARMALELEQRHGGKLGLVIVPVGLSLSAKEEYRSGVLVNFGEPIRVADYLSKYDEHRKESIQELSEEIARRIQGLILHIPDLEKARVVEAVKKLYLDHLKGGDVMGLTPELAQSDVLRISQRIALAVEHVSRTQPERALAFKHDLHLYEKWLTHLGLADESLEGAPRKRKLARYVFLWAVVAVAGAPIALYGWLHRLAPFAIVQWSIKRFAHVKQHKAQTSTTAIVSGLVSFAIFYSLYIWIFHRFFDWRATVWYGLSLPVTGLIAHYYVRELRGLGGCVGDLYFLVRAPGATRRLLALRAKLIAEIEAERKELVAS